MRRPILSLAVAAFLAASPVEAQIAEPEVSRSDFFVEGEQGLRLFVREVSAPGTDLARPPVLLLHGARPGALASFDVDESAGFSLAEDLAHAGHRVFLMDIRGYGNSDYPAEMDQPPADNPPLVGTAQAVRDIHAVVRALQERTGAERFALLGWATGSQWLGHYASLHPETVDRLIYYNGLVSGAGAWRPAEQFGRPDDPNTFDDERFGAYRLQTAEDLVGRWGEGGQDPTFIRRYQELALAGDEAGAKQDPPTFRVPNAALAESLAMTTGTVFWDASAITASVLIIRSEKDFWSRPEDPERLRQALTRSAQVRVVTLPNASHYAHLEKGPGRDRFLAEVIGFLGAAVPGQ